MDNVRLILVFALAFVLLLLYQAWMQDYGKPTQSAGAPTQKTTVQPGTLATDGTTVTAVPATPTTDGSPVPGVAGPLVEQKPVVRVTTDLFEAEISTRGGDLASVLLLDYPVAPETPDVKFQLLKPQPPNLFLAQSGLIGSNTHLAPTHEAEYSTERDTYRLDPGKDELVVAMDWVHSSGVKVTKKYVFRRGSYLIDVRHEVENDSGEPWTAREYTQLQRTQPPESDSKSFIYTFTGGAIYSPEDKYDKISFDEMAESKLDRDVTGGWISMIQHYFLAAWIPPAEVQEHFFTNILPGGRYVIGKYSPPVTVADGATHSFQSDLFVGPKLQDTLAEIAPGLELTVDYGWLTFLSQPLFWLLEKLHSFLGNWGWAIIFLTILIKIAFFKLSETSYKSMANMRRMTPRIQALKDRYGSDKQRLNQAMMDMYKKEKINPLGGCLPILVQIPVFIALYWVLLESVELRQAPFILWIDNLSAADPYFVLPLIMGVSMFIQQKLNPAPPDPMQAKIMMSLPVVFTVFFAFFPSGLVLYWVVNNILSIAQQWYITHKIEQAAA